jgi:hypothetical protein
MNRVTLVSLLVIGCLALALPGCAPMTARQGWTVLFDGSTLDNWDVVGTANWRLADGAVQADNGQQHEGYLVSKRDYADFQLKVEFWVDEPANSGVYIRCTDPQKITNANAYEVNIFDLRPDPTYGTGGIVNVARVANPVKAGGKWNTFEITASGSRFSIVLNGVETSSGEDDRHARGRIALQYFGGVAKFRKVEIRSLAPRP